MNGITRMITNVGVTKMWHDWVRGWIGLQCSDWENKESLINILGRYKSNIWPDLTILTKQWMLLPSLPNHVYLLIHAFSPLLSVCLKQFRKGWWQYGNRRVDWELPLPTRERGISKSTSHGQAKCIKCRQCSKVTRWRFVCDKLSCMFLLWQSSCNLYSRLCLERPPFWT